MISTPPCASHRRIRCVTPPVMVQTRPLKLLFLAYPLHIRARPNWAIRPVTGPTLLRQRSNVFLPLQRTLPPTVRCKATLTSPISRLTPTLYTVLPNKTRKQPPFLSPSFLAPCSGASPFTLSIRCHYCKPDRVSHTRRSPYSSTTKARLLPLWTLTFPQTGSPKRITIPKMWTLLFHVALLPHQPRQRRLAPAIPTSTLRLEDRHHGMTKLQL